jgi:coenzyme F420-0:L-glutamate ligase
MSERISIEAIPNMPQIVAGDDIGEIIVDRSQEAYFELKKHDILCIASKAVLSAEGNIVRLDAIEPSDVAYKIHERIPRKDIRAVQAIIDATGDPSGSRLEVKDNYVGGWLPNGLFLTSAGVDKLGSEELILLPENADVSARAIGRRILELTGVNVAVIITDSEGRPDKRGSAQIAIGVYGIPPLRVSEAESDGGKTKKSEETICDMLAASAALLMGQRGFNKPVVCIRGFNYEFDTGAAIGDALNGNAI